MAVSAVIQSAARLERGRTLNNVVIIHGSGWTQLDQIWHAGGREGEGSGRGGEGRGGEGRVGEGGRAGQGRGGEGRGGEGKGWGRGGEGRGGEGRGGDCPHFPQTRTFVTAKPSRPPAKRVTG